MTGNAVDGVGYCAIRRIKNNVPLFAIPLVFWYTKTVMVMAQQRQEQRQRFLKAKVAMALYSEYGRVPKEVEIDHVYHLTRVMYKAVLGTHYFTETTAEERATGIVLDQRTTMLIGYARVSTQDQILDLQADALKRAGCEKIFKDITSGAKSERPGLKEAMNHLRAGDTLVVWRLDRLGHTLKHLIATVTELNGTGKHGHHHVRR